LCRKCNPVHSELGLPHDLRIQLPALLPRARTNLCFPLRHSRGAPGAAPAPPFRPVGCIRWLAARERSAAGDSVSEDCTTAG